MEKRIGEILESKEFRDQVEKLSTVTLMEEPSETEGLPTWLGNLTKAIEELTKAVELTNEITMRKEGFHRIGGVR